MYRLTIPCFDLFSEDFQISETKPRKPSTDTTSSQTSPSLDVTKKYEITYEELTSDRPSEKYWKALAKKREVAIEETKVENEQLIERIASLECKIIQAKERLNEAKNLADIMTEMLEEKENEESVATLSQPDQSNTDV